MKVVVIPWMELSNLDSNPTVQSDPTGEIIWQKNRPILLAHGFIIDRNAIEFAHNLGCSLLFIFN
jgi:hypothetical protein